MRKYRIDKKYERENKTKNKQRPKREELAIKPQKLGFYILRQNMHVKN